MWRGEAFFFFSTNPFFFLESLKLQDSKTPNSNSKKKNTQTQLQLQQKKKNQGVEREMNGAQSGVAMTEPRNNRKQLKAEPAPWYSKFWHVDALKSRWRRATSRAAVPR